MRVIPPKGARCQPRPHSRAWPFFNMIAPKDAIEPQSTGSLPNSRPNSRRVYAEGCIHPELRVPMREIALADTKHVCGAVEANDAVRVYDTSGPWGDPDFHGDVERGLPPLRQEWILRRGDVRNTRAGPSLRAIMAIFPTPMRAGEWHERQPRNRERQPRNRERQPRNRERQPRNRERQPLEPLPRLSAAQAAPRERRPPGQPALVRTAGRRHPRDGIHRDPREPGPRAPPLTAFRRPTPRFPLPAASRRRPRAMTPPGSSANSRRNSPTSSPRNSSATRSPGAGRSSRPISITPRPSR